MKRRVGMLVFLGALLAMAVAMLPAAQAKRANCGNVAGVIKLEAYGVTCDQGKKVVAKHDSLNKCNNKDCSFTKVGYSWSCDSRPSGFVACNAYAGTKRYSVTWTPKSNNRQEVGGSQIVVNGPEAASHLQISADGGNLIVDGYLADAQQTGCTKGKGGATCPLDGVGSLLINMGDQGDKVEVLNALPIPLEIHLGGGSDKFIGNDEPDTCYSEGARRNRCITGGGDDTCITGQQNSDCVLGAGNDTCIHGNGSDGCWGGPGDDICKMGAGKDGCHGGEGNDQLYGGPDPDQLYGGPGTDFCDGQGGVGKSHTCETGPGH